MMTRRMLKMTVMMMEMTTMNDWVINECMTIWIQTKWTTIKIEIECDWN
jgi:hypothetical protein